MSITQYTKTPFHRRQGSINAPTTVYDTGRTTKSNTSKTTTTIEKPFDVPLRKSQQQHMAEQNNAPTATATQRNRSNLVGPQHATRQPPTPSRKRSKSRNTDEPERTHKRGHAHALLKLGMEPREPKHQHEQGIHPLMGIEKNHRQKRWQQWIHNSSSKPNQRRTTNIKRNPEWTIHTPLVPCLHYQSLSNSNQLWPLHYLSSPKAYQSVDANIQLQHWPQSKLTTTEIQAAITNGIVEPVPHDPKQQPSLVFLTPEPNKLRYRLVVDTLAVNNGLKVESKVRFQSLQSLRRKLSNCYWGSTFDFRAFYFQFQLSPDVRNHFTFEVELNRYRFCRLPMGFKLSADIAQFITMSIVHHVTLQTGVVADGYIDNILIAHRDRYVVEHATSLIHKICAQLHVTIGEQHLIQQTLDHRGIAYDLRTQSFKIRDKLTQKLVIPQSPTIWATWRKLICRIIYGTTIFDNHPEVARSQTPDMMSWYSFHQNTTPTKNVMPNLATILQMTSIITKLTTLNLPLSPKTQTRSLTIFTDASPTEMGAVITTYGAHTIQTFHKHITEVEQKHHITEIETQAVAWITNKLQQTNTRITLHIDNSPAMYAIRRGYSSNPIMNEAIEKLRLWCLKSNNSLHPYYIPTWANPADAFSRHRTHQAWEPPHWDILLASLGWGGVEIRSTQRVSVNTNSDSIILNMSTCRLHLLIVKER